MRLASELENKTNTQLLLTLENNKKKGYIISKTKMIN